MRYAQVTVLFGVSYSTMKHLTILPLVLALFASGCASIGGGAVPESVHDMVGGEYFTRHGLRQEKNRWRSTNYGRGTLVPVNTKVRVDDITSSTIRLTIVASGEALKLSNIEKYTGGGVDLLAERTLSTEPTDLSGFKFQKDIKVGTLRLGMTKEEAILARGYPPVHRTYSTEDDRWIYWQNRFVTQTVVFADGKLVAGRNIY